MNKRLAFLENLINSGKADAFARYGLAMEYKKEGRIADALSAFEELNLFDPNYVPQYLMAGQMLIDAGRRDEARTWLMRGIETAKKVGNSHALGELDSALASL
jgi:tetratricopeptide (TPR) repeat protein